MVLKAARIGDNGSFSLVFNHGTMTEHYCDFGSGIVALNLKRLLSGITSLTAAIFASRKIPERVTQSPIRALIICKS